MYSDFSTLDTNKDGRITREELWNWIRKDKTIEEILKNLDLDKDGYIEISEFMAIMTDFSDFEDHLFERAFKFFDTNNNSIISLEEMQQHLDIKKDEF